MIGSSPHTWGIPQGKRFRKLWPRFIPTYVGHTLAIHSDAIQSPVHPHLRGAYYPSEPQRDKRLGSSPPTWGIPVPPARTSSTYRFIPTYVGHTCGRSGRFPPRPVHPHIRGAYYRAGSPPILRRTVHPHIRGAYAMQVIAGFGSVRFIPTYVGHTTRAWGRTAHFTVHPHIRGAYKRLQISTGQLLRFIPTYVGHTFTGCFADVRRQRFIPTYVGHTAAQGELLPR